MSFPADGIESAYKNNIDDVRDFLEAKYPENYLVVNVSPRTYRTDKLGDRVCVYTAHTGYAMLLSVIPWNIPQVTHKPLGECVYQENTSDKWHIPWLYHQKWLHNFFIPWHRKYSGQMGRLGVIQLNCTD